MRSWIAAIAGLAFAGCMNTPETEPAPERPAWRLAIHGGAGVITPERITPPQEAAYHEALQLALAAGAERLRMGDSAVDAVEATVRVMEDNPLFNAGRGAVLTATGRHELDASIMSGDKRDAGAVAGVTRVRNPVSAARAVMEQSEHVMFAGPGADAFAREKGLGQVANSHFTTQRRREALERVLKEQSREDGDRHGTVGAIAIDADGHLAAATSTGGMTAKAPGRVGDSPLIGAATYAEDGVCAVSATGHGEYFIRVGVAKTICARARLAGEDVETAAGAALGEVAALGGDGGVIVMDGAGHAAFVFDTPGMYRGTIDPGGVETAIYGRSSAPEPGEAPGR